jgi:hypothetical protein
MKKTFSAPGLRDEVAFALLTLGIVPISGDRT